MNSEDKSLFDGFQKSVVNNIHDIIDNKFREKVEKRYYPEVVEYIKKEILMSADEGKKQLIFVLFNRGYTRYLDDIVYVGRNSIFYTPCNVNICSNIEMDIPESIKEKYFELIVDMFVTEFNSLDDVISMEYQTLESKDDGPRHKLIFEW